MTAKLRLIEEAPHDAASDDALMLRAAAGDRAAFAILVGRHERSLRRFCRSIAGDDSAARDAAQDALLRLWAARGRYRADGRFKAYLYTLARNAARSIVRKRRVRALIGLDEVPHTAPSAPDALAQKETIDLVSAALDRLPEKFRTPLLLRFVEELPYEDIARVIGRTPSAARSRVHYGLKMLAERLPEEVLP